MVTYESGCFFHFELLVLGDSGDYRAGKDIALFTDSCSLHYGDIAAYMCPLSDFHILVDGHEWLDYHARMDLGGGMYVCKWLFHSD